MNPTTAKLAGSSGMVSAKEFIRTLPGTVSTARRGFVLRNSGSAVVALAALWAAVATASATTYYAATTGSSGNSGLSTSAPWPLAYALANARSGDTVLVLPGTYSGDWEINKTLTLRSTVKWGARLVNMPYGVVLGYNGNAPGIVLDGFEIAYSSHENVDIYSPNCTVRNCWIRDAGINSRPRSSACVSSGVHSLAIDGTTVEYCLIENNGSTPGYDHGIYLSGSNLTVRGNVMRGNWGFGLHLYNTYGGNVDNAKVYNNLIYGNGVNPVNNWDGVYLVPRGSSCKIYLWNNTIIAMQGPPIQGAYGTVYLTNNIILGAGGSLFSLVSQTLVADYNLSTAKLAYAGPHDVVSSVANFVQSSSGLYWLTAASPARNRANPNVVPPWSFFGSAQAAVTDIGAFQYDSAYTADSRVLDPTPAGGADYWKLLADSTSPTNSGSTGTDTTGSGTTNNGLTIQASAGILTAPFIVTNGYVCQLVDTENADGGRAVYNFTITNAGVYVVSAVVNAANTSQNSLYVAMDGAFAEPYNVWDVPVTSGFQSQTVAWRGNGTWDADQFVPKAFNLPAGAHSLIIGGRERNTQVQSITIQPSPLTAPAAAPVLQQMVGQ